jgi:hypothetical protein
VIKTFYVHKPKHQDSRHFFSVRCSVLDNIMRRHFSTECINWLFLDSFLFYAHTTINRHFFSISKKKTRKRTFEYTTMAIRLYLSANYSELSPMIANVRQRFLKVGEYFFIVISPIILSFKLYSNIVTCSFDSNLLQSM